MSAPDWSAAQRAADRLADGWMGGGDGPGGAVALFDAGGLRGQAAGGLASIEHRVPFTVDTPSRYASISKQFMAAALLLEDVDLDRSFGSLIPDLDGPLAAVPLGRGLDMTGGLADMMEVLWQLGVPYTASLAADEIMRTLRRLPRLSAQPGTEMAYCNTGWRLAQSVIGAHSGSPYADVLAQRILAPLALPIAFPADEAEPVTGLATGYWQNGGVWRRGRYGMNFSASGGLAGSAAALAGWGAALLADRFPGLLATLAAPRCLADGTPNAYRLGLIESWLGGVRVLAHGGSLPGYRNVLLLAPDMGCGVVLLTNRDADALLPGLTILAALLGIDAPTPATTNPVGLFAAEQGPFWIELQPGAMQFMGAAETLIDDGQGGWRSLPSSLEVTLRREGSGLDTQLDARIGGVARRFAPVAAGILLDAALPGLWQDASYGAELSIGSDGLARFPAAGGLGVPVPLTPLPGARAIATLRHGPWQHRPCLSLCADGSLQVASHRSRVLRFQRRGAGLGWN